MTIKLGTETNPLRVAIIGAGPTGFYAADHLFKQKTLVVEVDMFDRLPTPFGLVRAGVAPDHQKIKSVTKAFDRIAANPRFKFYGYVEFGKDIFIEDLENHYHQVIYCTGAETDRKLNIPGIDLQGSYTATEFVAWYNGHPDYRDREFDLSKERVGVIGIGNVAMDVARILCRTKEELLKTDIANHALEALAESNIKEVFVLGRRGPAQAAFTTPEIKEMGQMEGCDVFVHPPEAELDKLSEEQALESSKTMQKVKILQQYAKNEPTGKAKKMIFRFLVSPTELTGNEAGEVTSMRIVKNELYATEAGTLRPKATDEFEDIAVDLVFRSIGYRGVPLPGVPFNDSWGVILNQKGRVINPDTQKHLVGHYTAGWIKRGPSGVIGTNKPDAAETVNLMLTDLEQNQLLTPTNPNRESAEALIKERQPKFFSYADWLKLNKLELEIGKEQGRPRVKFTTVEEMQTALGR